MDADCGRKEYRVDADCGRKEYRVDADRDRDRDFRSYAPPSSSFERRHDSNTLVREWGRRVPRSPGRRGGVIVSDDYGGGGGGGGVVDKNQLQVQLLRRLIARVVAAGAGALITPSSYDSRGSSERGSHR